MNLQASIDLNCVIVKEGGQYCVKSEDRSKNLGCKPSKGAAKKRLAQVEYFKHIKGGGPGSGRHKGGTDLRYDKAQTSLYGPGHTKELSEKAEPVSKTLHKVLLNHGFDFDGNEGGKSKYSADFSKVTVDGNKNWHSTHAGDTLDSGKGKRSLTKHLSQ